MRKQFIATAVFVMLFGLALTAESAELFTQSHAWTGQKWGSEVLRAEPVEVNLEAIRPREQGPYRIQTLASVASKPTFRIDGVEYEATLSHVQEHGKDNFTWFGLADSRWLSYVTEVDGVVNADLWTPAGYRSLRTRNRVTYLVDWDEEAIVRAMMQELVIMTATATVKHARRRAVRHPSNPVACNGEKVENIDQIAIYTPQALEWFSSDPVVAEREMRSFAQNAVDATNATIINTTGKWQYRLNLVHIAKFDYHDGSDRGGNMGEDLDAAQNSSYVQGIMAQNKADSLYMYVGMYLTGPGGAALFGYGWSISSVTQSAFIAVHENGHSIWKMGHNPLDWILPPGVPQYAYGNAVNRVARGVMAYPTECPDGCPYEPVFEMGDVPFPGTNIMSGITGKRENGRMLAWRHDVDPAGPMSRVRIAGNEERCVANSLIP